MEIANVACEQALRMQKNDDNIVLVQFDAANAFNSVDREFIYELLCQKEEYNELRNWFNFLYKHNSYIIYDHQTII
jgi:hypothetical protein